MWCNYVLFNCKKKIKRTNLRLLSAKHGGSFALCIKMLLDVVFLFYVFSFLVKVVHNKQPNNNFSISGTLYSYREMCYLDAHF